VACDDSVPVHGASLDLENSPVIGAVELDDPPVFPHVQSSGPGSSPDVSRNRAPDHRVFSRAISEYNNHLFLSMHLPSIYPVPAQVDDSPVPV
jgi:hypothetical protein